MSKQLNMEEFFGKKIAALNEPHMACALLLDTSGSMSGRAIKNLSDGVRRFKQQLLMDKEAKKRVDVAIITFDSEVKVISDFMPVTQMPTPALVANGRTDMAAGIQTAINMVRERTQMYSSLGTPCYKPWIFMITDGEANSEPQDMEEAARRIRLEEEKGSRGHLAFWALGIDDYNPEQLFSLTRRVVELKDQDFSGIFDWLSESMVTISHSRIDENIPFQPLPENARKTEKDRTIREDWN